MEKLWEEGTSVRSDRIAAHADQMCVGCIVGSKYAHHMMMADRMCGQFIPDFSQTTLTQTIKLSESFACKSATVTARLPIASSRARHSVVGLAIHPLPGLCILISQLPTCPTE